MILPLPLRLQAEPLVRECLKMGFFVLPTQDEDNVCMVVSDYGLIALVINCSSETRGEAEISKLIGCDEECLPLLRLECHTASKSTHSWIIKNREINCSHESIRKYLEDTVKMWPPAMFQCQRREVHRCDVAGCIVKSINHYYARQVLEPSIRGFLGILEKQFPRNDLYLFELLQNAVDDGATHVCFSARPPDTPGGSALEFFHDGRAFTALDVLGLASVGLSTKGIEGGPKRTIGFMGVGFKAVYKRFAQVNLSDSQYCFSFEEPSSVKAEPPHGWVLQPQWRSKPPFHVSKVHSKAPLRVAPEKWCRFILQKPRGGAQSIISDLSKLPHSVPPLLGRQSLLNAIHQEPPPKCWTLEWNGVVHQISRPSRATVYFASDDWDSLLRLLKTKHVKFQQQRQISNQQRHSRGQKRGGNFPQLQETNLVMDKWRGSGDILNMRIFHANRVEKEKHKYWRFLTVNFIPTSTAREAYALHTKRAWVGNRLTESTAHSSMNDQEWEETCVFFEENEDCGPIDIRPRGSVHSVLPTKLLLPCGLQWQGPWLLSVDRQEVQNVTDNAWNACLLQQAPHLFSCVIACAKECGSKRLREYFSLLPPMELISIEANTQADKANKIFWLSGPPKGLVCSLLGESIDFFELAAFSHLQNVVPCLSIENCIHDFATGNDVLWLPPTIVKGLPLSLLSKWAAGRRIFASNMLDNHTGWLPLWQCCLTFPTADYLLRNRGHFSMQLKETSFQSNAVSLVCKGTEVNETPLSSGGGAKVDSNVVVAVKVLATLQATKEAGFGGKSSHEKEATSTKPSSPRTEDLPPDECCSGWLPSLRHWPIFVSNDGTEAFASELILFDSSFASVPPKLRHLFRRGAELSFLQKENRSIMHPSVHDAILDGIEGVSLEEQVLAKRLLDSMCTLFPENVVSLPKAARMLQASWATKSTSESNVKYAVELLLWAQASSSPRIISHLLASSQHGVTMKFVPAGMIYLQPPYIDMPSGIKELEKKISDREELYYVSDVYSNNNSDPLKVGRFLGICGAQNGISLLVKAVSASASEIKREKVLSNISLRKNLPSANLELPYQLGPINKKNIYIVDCSFDTFWTKILSSQLSVESASIAAEFIASILQSSEYADPATHISVPAASALLSGKALPEDDLSVSNLAPCPGQPGMPLQHKIAAPGLKRAYFLPPGQPGASAVSLGATSWLKSLANSSWVPASIDGTDVHIVRPCECLLSSDSKVTDMPLARLPATIIKILTRVSATPVVGSTLCWGTVKPKPPLERLENLCRKIAADTVGNTPKASSQELAAQKLRPKKVDPVLHSELVALWRAIAVAYLENRLIPSDCSRLQQFAGKAAGSRSKEVEYTATDISIKSSIPLFPGRDNQVYPLLLCVSSASWKGELSDDQATANALALVGHLLDFNDPQWILAGVSDPLYNLMKPFTSALKFHCVDFLFRRCCPGEEQWQASENRVELPDISFRSAYSLSLWRIVRADGLKALSVLRSYLPNLQIYCKRGPTSRPDAHYPKWISAYLCLGGRQDQATVLPVLVNDSHINAPGCGIAKSTMLRPSHNVQPVTMLDTCTLPASLYPENFHRRLLEIDNYCLKLLGIPKLTDRTFTLSVSTKGNKIFLHDSAVHLKIILLLLAHIRLQKGINPPASEGPVPKAPQLIMCEKLLLMFSSTFVSSIKETGGAIDKTGAPIEKINIAAVWGAPSQRMVMEEGQVEDADVACDHRKPILLAGEPESYVADLEDLILSYIFGNKSGSLHGMHSTDQLSLTKTLRLLLFLENKEKFKRYLLSDFAGYCSVSEASLRRKKAAAFEESRESNENNEFLSAEQKIQSVLDACVLKVFDSGSTEVHETAELTRLEEAAISSDPEAEAAAFLDHISSSSTLKNNIQDSVSRPLSNLDQNESSIGTGNDSTEQVTADSLANLARSAGRGTNMLPSWMTNPGLESKVRQSLPENAKPAMVTDMPRDTQVDHVRVAEAESRDSHIDIQADPDVTAQVTADSLANVVRSAGRGISMLPSWMTNPGLEAEVKSSESEKGVPLTSDINEVVSALGKRPSDEESNNDDMKRSRITSTSSLKQGIYGNMPVVPEGTPDTPAEDNQAKLINIYSPPVFKRLHATVQKISQWLKDEEELSASQVQVILSDAFKKLQK